MTLHMHVFLGGLRNTYEHSVLTLIYGRQYANNYDKKYISPENVATKTYLSKVTPGDFYSFIVTKEQLPLMESTITTFGLKPYIHHRSSSPATNRGLQGYGPRLTVFIFKFPENPTFKDVK